MYIRLILTVREDNPKSYISNKVYKKSIVSNSLNKKLSNEINSIEILTKAYEYKPNKNGKKIDLIITPHNFFTFELNIDESKRKKIDNEVKNKLKEIAEKLNDKLKNYELKATLITGIDFIKQDNNGCLCFNSYFNPYSGIDSIVAYFDVEDNQFKLSKYIWESWHKKGRCDKDGIKEQKEKRIVSLKNHKICLLSCGDILGYCHCNGLFLPKADIYIDLAHSYFEKKYLTYQNHNNIHYWKRNDYVGVIVSQNLKKKFNDNYSLIWPRRFMQQINLIKDSDYIFIDIEYSRNFKILEVKPQKNTSKGIYLECKTDKNEIIAVWGSHDNMENIKKIQKAKTPFKLYFDKCKKLSSSNNSHDYWIPETAQIKIEPVISS